MTRLEMEEAIEVAVAQAVTRIQIETVPQVVNTTVKQVVKDSINKLQQAIMPDMVRVEALHQLKVEITNEVVDALAVTLTQITAHPTQGGAQTVGSATVPSRQSGIRLVGNSNSSRRKWSWARTRRLLATKQSVRRTRALKPTVQYASMGIRCSQAGHRSSPA